MTTMRRTRFSKFAPLGLLLCALGPGAGSAAPAPGGDISGAMTADYLVSCQRSQDMCMAFTNRVLEVLTTAAQFQQRQIYKGCAPIPLDIDATGQLVKWILMYPQQATGYAADDIAKAAEVLWPCK
jgi:hypothetical protein